MKNRSQIYLLVIIVAAGLGLRMIELNEPWIGLKDFTGALHGQIAENYVRFGYLGTAFGPVTNFEPNPERFTYYLHHPILFNIVLSIPVRLFGPHEWSMRLLPVFSSTAAIILIFLFSRMFFQYRIALFASIFLAFLPMEGYFGRMVNEETMAAPMIIVILIFYVRMSKTGGLLDRIGFHLFLILGLITAWPVSYLAGFLFLHGILYRPRDLKNLVRSAVPPALAVLVFALFLIYGRYLRGDWDQNLMTLFLERAGGVSALMEKGSLTKNVIKWSEYYFTPVTLFFSAFFFWKALTGGLTAPPGSIPMIILLFLVGISHILIFREGALRHQYWLYYFSTPIVLASAVGLDAVISSAKNAWLRRLIPIFVFGIFIPLSILRVQAVHADDRFVDVPALGEWIRDNTEPDAEILVIGPELSRFGFSPSHFDYYEGPIYTWPMPHFGFYAHRKMHWGIRDIRDLQRIIEDPGAIEYAVMTREYADSLVRAADEVLTGQREEIAPSQWGGRRGVSIKIFKLKSDDSSTSG